MSGDERDERARQYFIKRIKKVSEELDYEVARTIYYFILGYIGTDENGEEIEKNANKT